MNLLAVCQQPQAQLHINCNMNMVIMLNVIFWQVIMLFVFKYLFTHNDNVLHIIHFVFLMWHATKQLWGNNGACRAPQSESRLSSTRARCGSWDPDYVCLVYKCSLEQTPHFFSLSLGSIYTDSYSDINYKQRAFWFCHKKGSVC